jgi:hypothetical protein
MHPMILHVLTALWGKVKQFSWNASGLQQHKHLLQWEFTSCIMPQPKKVKFFIISFLYSTTPITQKFSSLLYIVLLMSLLMQDNFCKIFGNISTMTHVLCRSTAQQKTLLTCSNLLCIRHKFLVQIKLRYTWPMHLASGVHIFPILREPTEDTLCTTLHKKPRNTTIIATPSRCG